MPRSLHLRRVRTPIGRYGGALAKVRTDDLAAVPIKALMKRASRASTGRSSTRSISAAPTRPARTTATSRAWRCCWPGCRTRSRASRVNRLCASGLNAVGAAAQAIRAGEIDFAIAGGVESMTRAPFVMGKAQEAFQRSDEIHDTTIGWRFINPLMKQQYGVDSMPETAENVAEEFQVGAQGPGRLRAALAAARRQGGGRGLLRGRDRAGRGAGRQGRARSWSTRTSIRGRTRRWKGSPSSSRSSAIPAPSRPATPPASTTAPPP